MNFGCQAEVFQLPHHRQYFFVGCKSVATELSRVTDYTSYIIYRKEWALKWAVFLATSLCLAYMSSSYVKSKPLTILFFALMVGSFLFIKAMMKHFTRRAMVNLDTAKISFTISSLDDEAEERSEFFPFWDITSYNIQFPTERFACLTLYMNSGTKREFSFLRRHLDKTQTDALEVIEAIHSCLKEFNINHRETKTIEFAPSFLASKNGLYMIVFLGLFLLFGIGLAAGLQKNVLLTFLGSAFLIGHLMTRRATEMRYYKKMRTD